MERVSDTESPQKVQALNMAKEAGIELTYSQVMNYVYFRGVKDDSICSLSDHQMLHLFLDRDQRYLFEQKFNQMRFI
jgi:hypothetical protein